MADSSGDRSKYFAAIEKKHGGPISLWLDRLGELGDARYPEQMAYLQENHGFSRTHANALVMSARNSPTSRRFETAADYFGNIDPAAASTATAIFAAITTTYPELELVVAWNQPMLRTSGKYVLGLSAAKRHLLLNPFSTAVLAKVADQLSEYEVNKHTIKVPIDWVVDKNLLRAMAEARLAELA